MANAICTSYYPQKGFALCRVLRSLWMNREHEQREKIAAASISLAMSWNFMEALEGRLGERGKRGNKITVWNCQCSLCVREGQYLDLTYEQEFGEVICSLEKQRMHGMIGCLLESYSVTAWRHSLKSRNL